MKVTEARLKAALDRPPADIRLYFFHGPDESAAFAYAARLAKAARVPRALFRSPGTQAP